MDALPFIIEMLSENPFKDFLYKNEPHMLDNLNFVVQELVKVQRYMRWSDFEKQSEDQKQVLIKGLRLTVHKVGKFMSKIHAQYATNRDSSGSPDHDSHKTIDGLLKEWRDILNIFAGIVYCCYVLKSNQTREEFSLEEVYREDFEERVRNDNIISDQQVVELTRLNEQKSLQLFLIKAFPVLTEFSEPSQKKIFLLELSKELDNIPQLICKACHGLPLALVLLGSLLSLSEKINIDVWNEVKDALYKFNDHGNRLLDIINYCYGDLPYFLKPCFLYLACYPKGYMIPARSLIYIWIAEGFISAERKEETAEERAYKYLEQLVKRSLVDVSERSFLGAIKYCCVNPVIHEYAINKSKEEGFLVANPDMQTIESLFRVAIHSDNEYPYGELEIDHMHSFVAFHFKQNILQNAMFLRVLELQGSAVPNVTTLQNMTNIRYLGLRDTSIDALPESIGVMQNLQILDVRNTNIKTLPNSLWNISKLRHVYVLPSPEIKGPPRDAKLTDLQTLKTVAVPESWVGECPQFLINLRKLALSKPKDLDWKFVSNLLSQLVGLLSLTIISDSVPSEFLDTRAFPNLQSLVSIRLDGEWNCRNLFIDNVKIPPTLTKLTLTKSGLKENPMSRLGRIKSLKFLCLQDGAYNGERMVCLAEGFPELQILELSNLKCLKIWEVQREGFPQLQSLKLSELENLEEWVVEETGMSKLNTLRVFQCKKLRNVPKLEHVTDKVIDN